MSSGLTVAQENVGVPYLLDQFYGWVEHLIGSPNGCYSTLVVLWKTFFCFYFVLLCWMWSVDVEPSCVGDLADFLLFISQLFFHWGIIRGIDCWFGVWVFAIMCDKWGFFLDFFRHIFKLWCLWDMVSALGCFRIHWVLRTRIQRETVLWIPKVFLLLECIRTNHLQCQSIWVTNPG